MDLVEFPEVNCVFGEGQEQYRNLPAYRAGDQSGTVIFCWRLSPEEIKQVQETGCCGTR